MWLIPPALVFSSVCAVSVASTWQLRAPSARSARRRLRGEGHRGQPKFWRTRMADGRLPVGPIWTDVHTFPARRFRGVVDGVIGGYPCQPFSMPAADADTTIPGISGPPSPDSLAQLGLFGACSRTSPAICRLGFRTVADDLRGLGYDVAAGLFTASEVGAPTDRTAVHRCSTQRQRPAKIPGLGGSFGRVQPARSLAEGWVPPIAQPAPKVFTLWEGPRTDGPLGRLILPTSQRTPNQTDWKSESAGGREPESLLRDGAALPRWPPGPPTTLAGPGCSSAGPTSRPPSPVADHDRRHRLLSVEHHRAQGERHAASITVSWAWLMGFSPDWVDEVPRVDALRCLGTPSCPPQAGLRHRPYSGANYGLPGGTAGRGGDGMNVTTHLWRFPALARRAYLRAARPPWRAARHSRRAPAPTHETPAGAEGAPATSPVGEAGGREARKTRRAPTMRPPGRTPAAGSCKAPTAPRS